MGTSVKKESVNNRREILQQTQVSQRVGGGHNVPADIIRGRPRTMKNIATILPLVDAAWLLDNLSRKNPFQQVAEEILRATPDDFQSPGNPLP